jgi:hypothetical protein
LALQILKQDWPLKWTTFIPDIVNASKKNETLCENSMVVLKLLSEEVFDFSAGELTQVPRTLQFRLLSEALLGLRFFCRKRRCHAHRAVLFSSSLPILCPVAEVGLMVSYGLRVAS